MQLQGGCERQRKGGGEQLEWFLASAGGVLPLFLQVNSWERLRSMSLLLQCDLVRSYGGIVKCHQKNTLEATPHNTDEGPSQET